MSRNSLIAVSVFVALCGAPAIADAEMFTGEHYRLKVQHTSMCLDVESSSRADGAKVQQHPCHGGKNQQWRFLPIDATYFKIVNRESGKVLDPYTLDNGSHVVQWSAYATDKQLWRLEAAGGGRYRIINRFHDKALEILNASTATYGVVSIWQYWAGANQHFELEQVAEPYTCTMPLPGQAPMTHGVDMFPSDWREGLHFQGTWLSPWRNGIQVQVIAGPAVTWGKYVEVLDAENQVISSMLTENSQHGPYIHPDVLAGRNPWTLKIRFSRFNGFTWDRIASVCNLTNHVGSQLTFYWYRE